MAGWGKPGTRARAAVEAALAAAVAGALMVAGPGGAGTPTARADRVEAGPGLTLRPTAGGVRALDVPLSERDVTRTASGAVRSEVVRASEFSLVALTWRGTPRQARVKTRTDGAWTPWVDLTTLSDGPDHATAEGRSGVVGTDLRRVGKADAARVEVDGPRPDDLTLVLMAPEATPVQARRKPRPARPRPELLSRRAWGADNSLRSGSPTYNRTIQQVHVHHTVNGNDYSRADVPGLLRAIYRYHTQNLGWSDIGYNFVVDRFGRTWVGRAGGGRRPVSGAHTLGFNSTSTGVAVLGNFENAGPGHRSITAIVQLAAWKLHRHDRDPAGRVRVFSHGSDRYPRGRRVRLPTIDGHRDTNQTACPGALLYRHLNVIRRRAAERERRFR